MPTKPAIAFMEFGPRLGTPVLFVHGFPFDHRMWLAQADLLANKGYRVILPDLRGFGKTPMAAGANTVEAHVRDLLALADRLALAKFVLIGFSMGGYVVLEFARKHANRLRGLGLIDTRAESDPEEAKKGRNDLIAKVGDQGTTVLVDAMMPKMLTDRTRKAKPELVATIQGIIREQSQAGVIAALEALRDRPDQRANLAAITCPSLIIVGAEDQLTPLAASMAMQKAMPNAQLRIITGASHLTPMEAAEPVNHFLEDWLKNLDASSMAQTGIQRLGLKVEGAAKDKR